jgi:tetraacyldisaccharide 4'-kinase
VLPVFHLDAAVVSVGNLTAGGTGKTPMVALVARELARRGRRVGVLSRGYRAPASGEPNDEGLLLARLLPGVPQAQDKDRVRGGERLVEEGVDAIVLDDGFQHRRLARDLDLVLVDATAPFGLPARDGEKPVRALLPRGLLREPLARLSRAQACVLTRCDQVPAARLAALRAEIEDAAPGVPILRASHRPAAYVDARGARRAAAELAGVEVELVSAVGNPDAFERTVTALGAKVAAHRRFPDHHAYTREDLAGLGTRTPLTTAKDAVKLERLGVPCGVLEVELRIDAGASVLDALLDALPVPDALRERRALHEGLHG